MSLKPLSNCRSRGLHYVLGMSHRQFRWPKTFATDCYRHAARPMAWTSTAVVRSEEQWTVQAQSTSGESAQLVYATGRQQVTDAWIAGRAKLRDRALVDMDEAAIVANARQWRERIAAIDLSGAGRA